MLLKSLHIQGFTSYIDSQINFDGNTVYTINAPNGFGKSSILEAITTALFYRARGVDSRGAGMDNLINNTCNQFIITLEFAMNGIDYKIIRKKIRDGKHELEFYIDNISQTEKIADTQNKINDIIKMNYETFLDTVCIGQGLSNNFMKKKPNERKEVFAEILNLNDYNILEKYTKELKKELAQQININKAKLDVLEESFNQKDNLISAIKIDEDSINQFSIAINQLNQELEAVLKEKSQYELMQQQQQDLIDHKNTLANNLVSLNNKMTTLKTKYAQIVNQQKQDSEQIDSLKNLNTTLHIVDTTQEADNKVQFEHYIDELQEKITNNEKEISRINALVGLNKQKINDLKEQYMQLNQYDKGVCEFCGNEISPEHKQRHLQDLYKSAEKISNENKQLLNHTLQENITEDKNIIADYKLKIQAIERKIKQANNDKLLLEKNNSQIAILQNNLKLYAEQIEEIKINKQAYTEDLAQTQEQLDKYKDIEILPDKTFKDGILKTQINELQAQINSLSGNITYHNNKLIEINNNQDVYKTLVQEQKELMIKQTDYDSLIEAFGKKGIQADIISNVLPDIENEINEILKVLFNNSLSIEFTTQKESKSNTTLETLDIIIHDKEADRYYETYSGGEKFRIDFAFHVGLSKFLAKRANSNIEFFIIDEGLGSQDDDGKQNFIYIVNKLRNLFSQIFIITHIEDIKDAFDKKITVYKDIEKGSLIKI